MPSQAEIEDKFWKALKSDRTIMIAAASDESGDAQPMTAVLGEMSDAVAQFASKGHDLFAALHGTIRVHNDRAVIDRLWNPFIAAWYKGKDDPVLHLLRYDLDRAHIWLNENSMFAGVKMLLGVDPKKDYADKTADVRAD